jgi:cytochrome c2
VLLLVMLAGCSGEKPATPVAGDPEHGRLLFTARGCGTCHELAGVAGANGRVGPALTGIAKQAYIAGMLPNNPGNMARWIAEPQKVVPGNAMPDMGLSVSEARDLAAFLYTHRG